MMRAVVGAGHVKRECVLLTEGVLTEDGGLEFPLLRRRHILCLLAWSLGFQYGQHGLK